MALFLQVIFLSFFSGALPGGVERASVCLSRNPEMEIVRIYELGEVYEKMASLKANEASYRLRPDIKTDLRTRLNKAYADYQQQVLAVDMLHRIQLKMSQSDHAAYSRVMTTYLRFFELEKTRIEDELDENGGPRNRLDKAKLADQLKEDLQIPFAETMVETLESASSLDENDRAFLIEWSLKLYPDGPIYRWTPAANYLTQYLWWLKSNTEDLPTSGQFPRGIYHLEPIMNIANPGLKSKIAYRSAVDPEIDANLEIIYSPFSSKLEVRICTFDQRLDYCVPEPLDQWCQRTGL